MAKTPEEILKKLKPTKSFALTPESMKMFAGYVIDLGPDQFVARWIEHTSAKKAVKALAPKIVDPRVAILAERIAQVAKTTTLTPAEAAVAFINFSKESDSSIPAPPATAKKGPVPAIKWLVSKTGVEATETQLSAFEEQFA